MKQLIALIAIAVSSTACLRSTTTITVKADGSGTVVQETGVSQQTLAMIKGMAGGAPGSGTESMFGEEQAKKAADMMGVQFVSGEPIKNAEMEGYRARYSFTDIRNVRMRMNQADGLGAAEQTKKEPPFSFGFDRKGDSSVLTITVPEQHQSLEGLPKPPPGNEAANQQALQMMKVMMKGLYVDVALAVDGTIVKTNAPHVNGSTVTLLQVDFDKLLADEGALTKLQSATSLKGLTEIPGMKVIADRTVSIEFIR